MTPPALETERLILRGLTAADYPGYRAYYTGPRTAGVGGPKPEHVVYERFCAMVGQWALAGFGRFAITDKAAPEAPAFGHVGPLKTGSEGATEMTWTLWDETRTGQGYATEAARAAADWYFAQGHGPLLVIIDPDNAASIGVAERLHAVEDTTATPPAHFSNGRVYWLHADALQAAS
ncbi:MAG: GNAT family N-acetyltransferase [Pseudomonadota bacterium]